MTSHLTSDTTLAAMLTLISLTAPPVFTSGNVLRHQVQQYKTLTSHSLVVSRTFPARSLVECGLRCTRVNQSVFTYTPSSSLNSCRCGSVSSVSTATSMTTVAPSSPLYGPVVTSLYVTERLAAVCDTSAGYQIYVNETSTVSVCAKIVLGKFNYNQSESACNETSSSRLFVADSVAKLELLRQEAGDPSGLWVGMDDREEEGRYVWADGRIVTQLEFDVLFYPGEPNNYRGREDCVCLKQNYVVLNDESCHGMFGYVCEIPAQ